MAVTRFSGRRAPPHPGGVPHLPDDVAREAYRGLMANKRAVLPGLGIKIVPLALRLVPRGLVLAAVGRFQRKR